MKKTVSFLLLFATIVSLCAIFSGCSLILYENGYYFREIKENGEIVAYEITGCTKRIKKQDVIEIPSVIRGLPVWWIDNDDDGFSGTVATKIIVPEGVVRISDGFENCPNLETVELPDTLIEMFDGAFDGSPNVGTVENGFRYVDGWAVERVESDQYALRADTEGVADFVSLGGIQDAEGNVHLPEGMRYIGYRTLDGLVITGDMTLPSSLKNTKYAMEKAEIRGTLTIPEGITTLYSRFFCETKISRLVIECSTLLFENLNDDGVFYRCTIDELVVTGGVLYCADMSRATVKKVTAHAASLPYLFVAPDVLEVTDGEIPQGAFKQRDMEELILGEGVTVVGPAAFAACESLYALTVKNADASIAADAFYQTKLRHITAPASVLSALPTENCTELTVTSGAITTETLGTVSKVVELTLGNAVSSVAENALSALTALKTAAVPAKYVGVLPKGRLTKLTVTGGTSLDGAALTGATDLIEIILPAELSSVGENAFADTTALKAVRYGGTVQGWASIAFANAAANPLCFAKSLYIDNSVVIEALNLAAVESYAFAGYASLAQVTFAPTLTKIGEGAFSGCTALTALTLGTALTEIGRGAFAGCDSLSAVQFASTEGWNREQGDGPLNPVSDYYLVDAARAAQLLVVTYPDYAFKKVG